MQEARKHATEEDLAVALGRDSPPVGAGLYNQRGRSNVKQVPVRVAANAVQLVHLYAERGSPKFELAARRWLVRYLSEGSPSLRDVAKVTASLAERQA